MPKVVAYFVIAFLVFWFYLSFKNAFLGITGYNKIKKADKTIFYCHSFIGLLIYFLKIVVKDYSWESTSVFDDESFWVLFAEDVSLR